MTNANYPNAVSHTSEHDHSFLGVSPSNMSRQAGDFQKKVADEIAQMLGNEFAVDAPQDFGDVGLQNHILREPADSQPLSVEPPLTLSKIFSKLTAVEQLWLARMVASHGKELILARWPAYEIHINYVRWLR